MTGIRRIRAGATANATKRVESVVSGAIGQVFQSDVFQPDVFQMGAAVTTELTKRVGQVPGPTVQG